MLILQDVTAVQFEPAQVQSGIDIAVEGSLIKAVGAGLAAQYPQAQVRPMHGRLVMPGIVCSHNHFYSGLARGIMANIEPCPDFISTLKNLWWRLDRALDEESLYYSGLVCSLEAIKSGCTAVIDHHASPNFIGGSLDTLRRGFLEAGLRGITCYETTHRNGGDAELKAGVDENVAFARQIDAAKAKGDEPYLVEAMIGAHAPFTILAQGHGAAARSRAVDGPRPAHPRGRGPLRRFPRPRCLRPGPDRTPGLAPARSTTRPWSPMACTCRMPTSTSSMRSDAFLVHNPRSNMNNHVGYNGKLGAYRNLALGTDGIGADMFEELKFAFFKHRDAGGPMWPDSFLRFLWNGNRILERNFGARFGRLEAGCKADLTICDYDCPTPLVAQNLGGSSGLRHGFECRRQRHGRRQAGLRASQLPLRRGADLRRRAQGSGRAVEAHGRTGPRRRLSMSAATLIRNGRIVTAVDDYRRRHPGRGRPHPGHRQDLARRPRHGGARRRRPAGAARRGGRAHAPRLGHAHRQHGRRLCRRHARRGLRRHHHGRRLLHAAARRQPDGRPRRLAPAPRQRLRRRRRAHDRARCRRRHAGRDEDPGRARRHQQLQVLHGLPWRADARRRRPVQCPARRRGAGCALLRARRERAGHPAPGARPPWPRARPRRATTR